MRLIDADELTSELYDIYNLNLENADRLKTSIYLDGFTRAIRVAKSAPTVMQWVSVENALPPPETLVLVYHRAGFFHKGVNETMQITIGSYSNKWHSGFTGNGLLGVTHWMSLPPPPGKQNTFTSE